MFKPGKKIKENAGLDIGSYSVKVSSVLKQPDKNILTAYNIKRVPLDGGSPANTAKIIKEAFDDVDVHPDEINLSISGANVIVRFISLPKMSKEQLESAMIFEAEKYIPFDVNEVIMDFIILDAPEAGQMNVLLAAAKRDFVQAQIEMMGKLGMEVKVMDINAFAVFNSFAAVSLFEEDKGTAFLDLGFSQTNVLISMGALPRFMRLIQIGGKDIAHLLAGEMGISIAAAEELKLKSEDANRDKIDQFTLNVLEELVREIQLSFGYFENKYSKSVSDIYCSGGMVYQRGVIEYLQENLNAQLKVWSPLEGMEVSESLSREAIDPIASQLAGSIGLALRG